MQDLCHATRYVRTSSNPMGRHSYKVFTHLNFGVVFFSCVCVCVCVLLFFIMIFCVYPFFFLCVFVLYFLVVLFFVVVFC